VDPKRLAVWDLESLHEAMSVFFYEVYPQRPHAILGTTPANAYARGIQRAGARALRPLPPTEDFDALFLPGSGKGTLMNRKHRGLRFNQTTYRQDLLDEGRLDGVAIPFRYDPWDVRHIHGYIEGHWRECVTRSFDWIGLGPLSERALAIASTELKKKGKQGPARSSWDTVQGDFLRDLANHGDFRNQLRKDAAVRKIGLAAGIMPGSSRWAMETDDESRSRPPESASRPRRTPRIVELGDL
jgi:hypothetical protein